MVASSSRRSFSASYSSLASGLTFPSASRRDSSRVTRAASSSRSTAPSSSDGSRLGLARVRRGSQRLVETPCRLPRLAVEPRQLDLDPVHPLGRLVDRVAHLDLGGAEAAELCTELSGASGACVHPRAHGRLEARSEGGCALE